MCHIINLQTSNSHSNKHEFSFYICSIILTSGIAFSPMSSIFSPFFQPQKRAFFRSIFAPKLLSNHNILWSNPTFYPPNHILSSELSLLRAPSTQTYPPVLCTFCVYLCTFLAFIHSCTHLNCIMLHNYYVIIIIASRVG